MSTYKLDDLMDWGRVLAELEELRERNLLDEHQDGLRRILRYRRNWQLRECALECVRNVCLPENQLVAEVCAVMCDEDAYPELRMLAADVLADLACKAPAGRAPSFEGITMPEKIRELLATPLNPLLAEALQKTLIRIEEDVR